MPRAYYNEIDPFAVQWMRNLMNAGLIMRGDIDTRSIEDVKPRELRGYTQCHFFAGIGTWSYALRQAGWPDGREVWTGSCPCQPFSAAGKGRGTDDERHLWPHFHWLIDQCRPVEVYGEQVASKDGLAWLDLVLPDLERSRYAGQANDLCAAGVGAPHIRQRLYWHAKRMADAEHDGLREHRHSLGGAAGAGESQAQQQQRLRVDPADGSTADRLGHADDAGLEGLGRRHRAEGGHGSCTIRPAATPGRADGLAHGDSDRCGEAREGVSPARSDGPERDSTPGGPGPTDGFWRAADWLWCRDGKWRPSEPGTFPLAPRTPERVGTLRAYGNGIVLPLAVAYIEATQDW